MSNSTGNDRLESAPWNSILAFHDSNFAVPGSTTIAYTGTLFGRDASGNFVVADDTSKYELAGVLSSIKQMQLDTTDSVGDKKGDFNRPVAYKALIASAAAGDEGKKVFVKFNNEVSYSPGTNANYAGTVLQVLDSTHVLVAAPWVRTVTQGAENGIYTTAAAAPTTLTKWDLNKTILMPLTSSEAITLPAASKCSPSDVLSFINTSANSSVPTLTAAGADTINGGATYLMSATQYSQATLKSDGVSKWYVGLPGASGTVGATTFNANSGTSSATFTVTDNVGNTFAVGPNGATNPALTVDCSVGSAATGINIIGRAAGAGVTLATVTSGTDEDLLVAPAGAGGVKVTSHSANSLAVGRQGSTSPTLVVDSSTATCVTGMKLKSAASGGGFALSFVGGTNENVTVDAGGSGTLTFQSVGTGGAFFGQSLLVNGAAKTLGYGTGAGGAVSQASSRTTSVTLNTATGAITLVSAAGSATPATFTLTNSTIAATDTVIVSQKSGTDVYEIFVTNVAAGSCKITSFTTGGTTTETPVFNFAVIKGVAA